MFDIDNIKSKTTLQLSYTDYWQCIWAHIHGLCSYDPEAIVKNLYSDFMILQDVFLTWKVCSFLHFTWNLVLILNYHN